MRGPLLLLILYSCLLQVALSNNDTSLRNETVRNEITWSEISKNFKEGWDKGTAPVISVLTTIIIVIASVIFLCVLLCVVGGVIACYCVDKKKNKECEDVAPTNVGAPIGAPIGEPVAAPIPVPAPVAEEP